LHVSSLNSAETYKEDGADGLRRMCHINGSLVANHFRHEGKGPTMVEVEMRNYDTIQILREAYPIIAICDDREVWKLSLQSISHTIID
jgi:hypothetical protein